MMVTSIAFFMDLLLTIINIIFFVQQWVAKSLMLIKQLGGMNNLKGLLMGNVYKKHIVNKDSGKENQPP